MTHTPGPWIVDSLGDYVQVKDRNDRMIARAVFGHDVKDGAFAGGAVLCAQDDGGVANANLIAAAPELLEAAISMLRMNYGLEGGNDLPDAVVKMRKAVARASGQV